MEIEMEKLTEEREIQLNTGAGNSTVTMSTTRIESTHQNSVRQLSKAMGDLSLKDKEIEKLKV